MIELQCGCGEIYHAEESHVGKSFRCLKCDTVLSIGLPKQEVVFTEAPRRAVQPNVPPASIPHPESVSRTTKIGLGTFLVLLSLLVILILVASRYRHPPVENQRSPSVEQEGEKPLSTAEPPSVVNRPDQFKTARPYNFRMPAPETQIPPCAQGRQPQRLETGERIEDDNGTSGQSTFEIINGTDYDAVVRLVDADTSDSARFVYIRSHDSFTMTGIEPGRYVIRWEAGHGWIGECLDFSRNSDYGELDAVARFRQDSRNATAAKATLNPVLEGNIDRKQISREIFLQGVYRPIPH